MITIKEITGVKTLEGVYFLISTKIGTKKTTAKPDKIFIRDKVRTEEELKTVLQEAVNSHYQTNQQSPFNADINPDLFREKFSHFAGIEIAGKKPHTSWNHVEQAYLKAFERAEFLQANLF
jgi:plasmid replication initiation protein